MTDRGKQNWNKILAGFTLTLLTLMASGIGYLVVKGDRVDAEQSKRIGDLEVISYNLGQNCLQNSEQWSKHDAEYNQFKSLTQQEFMELWKMMPRGAKLNK